MCALDVALDESHVLDVLEGIKSVLQLICVLKSLLFGCVPHLLLNIFDQFDFSSAEEELHALYLLPVLALSNPACTWTRTESNLGIEAWLARKFAFVISIRKYLSNNF